MPGSNTGDLPQTLVSLPGQLLGVPSAGDALVSVTLGDADHVNHLILGEHLADGNLLLKVLTGKVDLVGNGTSVQLNLHDESLLLGLGPVLVEPPLTLLADVLSPHGLESPHAARSLDVADHADGDHGRGLDDGDRL